MALIRPLLTVLMAGTTALAQAQQPAPPLERPAARGLIVQLRELPTADEPATRERRVREMAREAGLNLRGVQTPIGRRLHLLRFDGPLRGAALDDQLRRARLHPDVAWVEPDVLVPRLDTVPDDPGFALQWHLKGPATDAAAINLPAAWDITTGLPAAVVAVLDTGVRGGHPDLAGQLLAGRDMVSEVEYANDGDGRDADPTDPGDWVSASEAGSGVFRGCSVASSSWHGTFIAGQIAAATNNATGVAGVSWGGRVLPVRVAGKCGAFLSDILDGLRWAAGLSVAGSPANPNPARVINLSFGGDAPCGSSYQTVIDEITAAGALLVVAAGNDAGPPRRPADCRNVLTAAAVQANGAKTSYSNLGAAVGLAAPGGSTGRLLYSLTNSGAQGPVSDTYGYKQGTSFSTPLVVGVASLMLSVNPALTPAKLIERLKGSARAHVTGLGLPTCVPSGTGAPAVTGICQCDTATCGAGLLDAAAAVADARRPVARIAAPGSLVPGAVLTLDGRDSAAAAGAVLVSHQWTQLSGPTVTLNGSSASLATVTLAASPASYEFRLRVMDDSARMDDSVLTVSVSAPSAGGGGGGALSWPMALALVALAFWALRRPRRSAAG